MLHLRGMRTTPGNSSAFDVSAYITRVPCQGQYLFTAAQENTLNGNSQTYEALIRLFDAHPTGARCGLSPPRLPGHVEIALTRPGGSKIFTLEGDRQGGGSFAGPLTFGVLPECGGDLRLRTELGLFGWKRGIDFKVQILEFHWAIQEHEIAQQC